MPECKIRGERACKKCLKAASAFLKAQIALLRVNERMPEASFVIGKLKACVKMLNEASADKLLRSTVYAEERKNPSVSDGKHRGAPARADKPGAYVKNFFEWLSDAGVALPESMVANGLNLGWSVKNLGLWRPLFATNESLTKADRVGHRFWSKPFSFAGVVLYVNSQWYGGRKGARQKAGFDRFAVELAAKCGLLFSPYALSGIPKSKNESIVRSPMDEAGVGDSVKSEAVQPCVTIRITSLKKKTFRIKG